MSKNLKTSVKLNTSDAVKALDRLEKKIQRINNITNKTNSRNSGLTRSINNATHAANKLDTATKKVANSAGNMNRQYSKTSSTVTALTKKVRGLASAYLGVMGASAMFQTADAITSAKNRLNYFNGGDGTTQESMDKMYASAQKVRMGYTDMMGNVSKSIVLAGDAFDNNIDNAVRFQEIMAEAYTIGGASAQEMHSSMYQMIQGLGSGILQGDELRSVREGAPIAYKEIEKFAQKVYECEDSLKDMASQGMITSELVVAAMMNAGDGIDKAFAKTDMTFSQMWTNMKNTVTKAFEPLLQSMSKLGNSDQMEQVMLGVTNAILLIAKALTIVWNMFSAFFTWFVDNWYWIQYIVYAVVFALGVYLGILAAQAIKTALIMFWNFITTLHPLYLIIIAIGLIIAAIVYIANTTKDACEFIIQALLVIAMVIMLIGVITGSTALVIVGTVIAAIAIILLVFMQFGQQIMGAIYVIGAWFVNVWNMIKNVAIGVWKALCAIANNIKVAFVNAWYECKAKFWDFVSTVYSGVLKVANLINKVLSVFGIEIDTTSLENAVRTAKNNAEKNRSEKLTYQDVTDAYLSGADTYSSFEEGWASTAYSNGMAKGAEWQNAIGSFASSVQDKITGFNLGDQIGKLTGNNGQFVVDANKGLNPGDYGTLSPTISGSPEDIAKKLGDIGDDTGNINDKMDLTAEDLEYLRKIAALEWKKEFTTANITVDMTNYNQVNGDNDLDGIVTTLTRKLYEELDAVAEGVYV